MFWSLQIAGDCCGGDCGDATEDKQDLLLAGQQDILAAIAAQGGGSGSGTAIVEKQDEIIGLLQSPSIC